MEKLIVLVEENLNKLKTSPNDTNILKNIPHPEFLLYALKDFNAMIGHEELKQSQAKIISYLIHCKNTGKESEQCLHTILYGNPGTGKTEIGKKLARIWYALGYIKGRSNVTDIKETAKKLLSSSMGGNMGGSTMIGGETFLIFMVIFYIIYFVIMFGVFCYKCYNTLGKKYFLILSSVLLVFLLIISIVVYRTFYPSEDKEKEEKTDRTTEIMKKFNVTTKEKQVERSKDMPNDSDIFNVVSVEDFQAEYAGQTPIKTKRLLEDNLGGVIFIDEAYNLVNSNRDQFGNEAAGVLNRFMSENSNKIIVILAGYEDKLKKGLFKVQPGIPDRCKYKMNCQAYNSEELARIYVYHLTKRGYSIDKMEPIYTLFEKNVNEFKAYGRSVVNLVEFTILEHSQGCLENISNRGNDKVITLKEVKDAINELKKNNMKDINNQEENILAKLKEELL